MKKNILSTIFSCTLALFIAVALLAGCLCAYASATICDPTLLMQTGKECSYTQELYEEIKYDWENLLAITGVKDMSSVMSVLTQAQVEADALAYLEASYTGSAKIDTAALEEALEEKIRAYALSNNVYSTSEEELERNIADLVAACIQEYKGSVSVSILPKILGTIGKIGKYLLPVGLAAAAAALLLTVFLFFLQRKRANTLYFASFSTAANAILFIGAAYAAAHYQLLKRLPIEASALKTLLDAYLQRLLDGLWSMGQVLLWITVLLLLLFLLCNAFAKLLQSRKKKQA